MMALVVQMIQELGVEVQHIPGGCTPLCQPADVGFNKPFKDWMQRQWLNWMIAEGIIHGTTSPPTRLDVAKWVNTAMLEMKGEGQIIRIAWKRHGYEWFVDVAMKKMRVTMTMVPRGRFKSLRLYSMNSIKHTS